MKLSPSNSHNIKCNTVGNLMLPFDLDITIICMTALTTNDVGSISSVFQFCKGSTGALRRKSGYGSSKYIYCCIKIYCRGY